MRLIIFVTSLICLSAVPNVAQGSKPNSLPRIGTIKDYKATGLMTGCGNLYFYHRNRTGSTDADYVFLSRGDGSHAWMNLNGRDVRLRQIKRAAGSHKGLRGFNYRYGNLQITVAIESFNSKTSGDSDPMYQMKITVRRGRVLRVVQAVGDTDC